MSTRTRQRLRTAISDVGHNLPLKDGRVQISGVELDHVPLTDDHGDTFHRMGRRLEFDVCELSLMSYYAGRDTGLGISAIPVAPLHMFHHRDFVKHVDAGIETPKDLEGKKVGTRSYSATPGVLDRGILSDEFGVDLDEVTWVLAEPEHVAGIEERYRPNVVPGAGGDLFPRLVAGELDAGIAGSNLQRGRTDPRVVPLFPNADELDRTQYERTGVVPVFTVVVIKDVVLDDHPWVAEALYEAFKEARGYGLQPNRAVARIVDGDPVPFGLRANRPSFEETLRLGREQHILVGDHTVDTLFPPFD